MGKDIEKIYVTKRKKKQSINVPAGLGFELNRQGKRTLVTPFAEARWDKVSPWWRSLVYQRGGEVVSTGLPKFWDWESKNTDQAYIQENWDHMSFREKLDGRLLIRSVYGSAVWWRTRTSFDADSYLPLLRKLIEKDNPLWDPNYMKDSSLCFELLIPEERIVISHMEPDLFFITAVEHKTLLVHSQEILEKIQGETHIKRVPLLVAKDSEPKEFVADVKEWQQREGVVIYDNDGFPLARIKSHDYKLRHALRYDYPPGMLKKLGEKRFADISKNIVHPELKQIIEARWKELIGIEDPGEWGFIRNKFDEETKLSWSEIKLLYKI